MRTSRIVVATLRAACAPAPAAHADAPQKVCVPIGDELHDLLVG